MSCGRSACLLVPAAILMLTLPLAVSAHAQQTKVTIGKVIGGDGFHVPTYVALDQGFFKAEGLDGSLLELDPRRRSPASFPAISTVRRSRRAARKRR